MAVVEDDDALRDSLTRLFGRHGKFACVGAFSDAASGLAALPGLAPDVALMDIQLPDRSGIECVAELRTRAPQIQAVMLTTFDDDLVFSALGGRGKGVFAEMRGARGNPGRHRRGAWGRLAHDQQHRPQGGAGFPPSPRCQSPAEGLTPRETELLEHLARGLAYKQVADRLGISIDTVRSSIRVVYDKLQVHSRTEAVMKFIGRAPRPAP